MEPCHSLCVAAHRRGPQTRVLFSCWTKVKFAFVSSATVKSFTPTGTGTSVTFIAVPPRSPPRLKGRLRTPRSTQVLSILALSVHSIMLDCCSVRYRSLSPSTRESDERVSRAARECATPQRPRVPSTLIRNFLVVDFCRARARRRRGGGGCLSNFICTPCRVRSSHLLRTIIY